MHAYTTTRASVVVSQLRGCGHRRHQSGDGSKLVKTSTATKNEIKRERRKGGPTTKDFFSPLPSAQLASSKVEMSFGWRGSRVV